MTTRLRIETDQIVNTPPTTPTTPTLHTPSPRRHTWTARASIDVPPPYTSTANSSASQSRRTSGQTIVLDEEKDDEYMMSKSSGFAPTPLGGSRPPSPPIGSPINGQNEDKQAFLMSPIASNRDGQVGGSRTQETSITTRDQVFPIIAYCCASIMMTVVNKYVVSGRHFTMTFLLLAIQSAVCVLAVWSVKRAGVITFRDFDKNDAKAWFPVSALLVAVIYTGSKALQFLSIPVYTIFKNLTIILIAYGEVFMFNGTVTGLTLCSFALMVGSSVIAAWSDISSALTKSAPILDSTTGAELLPTATIGGINAGYFWMAVNCLASAAYVLYMRKRIKVTGFKDWDSMFYNNLLSIPVLVVSSVLLEDWGYVSLNANFPPENRFVLLSAIAFSGAAAVGISYSTAWCVRVCGSTTYSMVGALNKLPVAASGMLFFGDPASFGNVTAIGVGGVAGIVYAVAKTNQARVEAANRARAGAAR